jgi:putative DNA primase/helicase
VFQGTGANGKGTILNAVRAILADYAAMIPNGLLMEQRGGEQHPTGLTCFDGRRFALTDEITEGSRWNEALLKSLSAGDPQTARRMRQDFYDFTPTAKIFVSGNSKPGLRTVDEAWRRRIHLVEFRVTIPEGQRDTALADKLKAEWPAILHWMVEGCLSWQQDGLKPPSKVTEATSEYLASQDAVGQWIEERCKIDPAYSAGSTALWDDWREWAERTGEIPGTQKRLSDQIAVRKFKKGRDGTGRVVFQGIGFQAKNGA